MPLLAEEYKQKVVPIQRRLYELRSQTFLVTAPKISVELEKYRPEDKAYPILATVKLNGVSATFRTSVLVNRDEAPELRNSWNTVRKEGIVGLDPELQIVVLRLRLTNSSGAVFVAENDVIGRWEPLNTPKNPNLGNFSPSESASLLGPWGDVTARVSKHSLLASPSGASIAANLTSGHSNGWAWSPSGRLFASGGNHDELERRQFFEVHDLEKGALALATEHPRETRPLVRPQSFFPDERFILGSDGVLDWRDGVKLRFPHKGELSPLGTYCVLPAAPDPKLEYESKVITLGVNRPTGVVPIIPPRVLETRRLADSDEAAQFDLSMYESSWGPLITEMVKLAQDIETPSDTIRGWAHQWFCAFTKEESEYAAITRTGLVLKWKLPEWKLERLPDLPVAPIAARFSPFGDYAIVFPQKFATFGFSRMDQVDPTGFLLVRLSDGVVVDRKAQMMDPQRIREQLPGVRVRDSDGLLNANPLKYCTLINGAHLLVWRGRMDVAKNVEFLDLLDRNRETRVLAGEVWHMRSLQHPGWTLATIEQPTSQAIAEQLAAVASKRFLKPDELRDATVNAREVAMQEMRGHQNAGAAEGNAQPVPGAVPGIALGAGAGSGVRLRSPQSAAGTPEYSAEKVIIQLLAGDVSGLEEYISPKCKGILGNIRDGHATDKQKEDLKKLFSGHLQRLAKSRTESGAKVMSIRNDDGATITFKVKKEGEVQRIIEMDVKPASTKKR